VKSFGTLISGLNGITGLLVRKSGIE